MTSANGFIDRTARTAVKLPLPRIVATMLGVAAAFFCFAMPQDVLDGLLGTFGVPGPIGPVGRTLFLLVFTALVAGIGWLVVTIAGASAPAMKIEPEADSAPLQPRRRSFNPTDPSEALNAPLPTLLAVRRGDAHPDAPPRRPIFADHDLAPLDGEFAEIDDSEAAEPVQAAPVPALVEAPADEPVVETLAATPANDSAAVAPEVEAEAAEPVAEVDALPAEVPATDAIPDEPFDLTEALPVDEAPAPVETIAETPEAEAPELASVSAPAKPEPMFPAPVAEIPPAPAEPVTIVPPAPAPEAKPVEPTGDRSLSELMARLETGLERRSGDLPPPPRADAIRPTGEAPVAPEEALRQALEALQRMAARQR